MAREGGPKGKGKITNAEGTSRSITENAGRQGIYISNASSEKKLWLCLGETAVAEEGILVEPKTNIHISGSYNGKISGIGSPLITTAEY